MIKAIKKGYFFFPGNPNIRKSYAYIFGFLKSVDFTMGIENKIICYNYVEEQTETIKELSVIIKKKLKKRGPIISLPKDLLLVIARLVFALNKRSSIHPVRVKKAAMGTHVYPKFLIESGYKFDYDFGKSIEHWMTVKPNDFD
jgi:hypothetical protein